MIHDSLESLFLNFKLITSNEFGWWNLYFWLIELSLTFNFQTLFHSNVERDYAVKSQFECSNY